jgi:hypothetical protein
VGGSGFGGVGCGCDGRAIGMGVSGAFGAEHCGRL